MIISKFYFWSFLTQHWTIYSEGRAAVWGLWCPAWQVGLFPYLQFGLRDLHPNIYTWKRSESAKASLLFKSPWFTCYLWRSYFSSNYLLEICKCYLCLEDTEVLLVPWELQLLISALGSAGRDFWVLGSVSLGVPKPLSAEDDVLGMGWKLLLKQTGISWRCWVCPENCDPQLNLCSFDGSSKCVLSTVLDSFMKVKVTSCKCCTTLSVKGFKICTWCYFHGTFFI